MQIKICSDIFDKSKVILKPCGFSVILFAYNCPKDNKTMRSIIKLQSNITRRMANKTAECPYEHSAMTGDNFFNSLLIFWFRFSERSEIYNKQQNFKQSKRNHFHYCAFAHYSEKKQKYGKNQKCADCKKHKFSEFSDIDKEK